MLLHKRFYLHYSCVQAFSLAGSDLGLGVEFIWCHPTSKGAWMAGLGATDQRRRQLEVGGRDNKLP
jgi:hypothetical protein